MAEQDTKAGIPEGGFSAELQLEAWLQHQKSEVAGVLAWRAAARVTSLLSDKSGSTVLKALRGLAYARCYSIWPEQARSRNDAPTLISIGHPPPPLSAIDFAFFATIFHDSPTDRAVRAVSASLSSCGEMAGHVLWKQLTCDARLSLRLAPRELAAQPIWLKDDGKAIDPPSWVESEWYLFDSLLSSFPSEEDWSVWRQWYANLLFGRVKLLNDPAIEMSRLFGLDSSIAVGTGETGTGVTIQLGVEITDDDWQAGGSVVNPKIRQVLDFFAVGDQSAASAEDEWDGDQASLPSPEDVQQQTVGAVQFRLTDDGRADLDASAGVLELLTDRDARDRHAETRRIAEKLRVKAQSSETWGNANDEIVEGAELVLESLGDRVEDVRPGKLITRGEALRQLDEHNQKRDQYSDLPPLPDDVALLLANWVNAYNQMVGLDPALAKADEARLGPDARKNLVSPEQGRALAQSAGEAGVATPDAVAAIEDEAKIAPSSPDAENRNSRRFSEGIKNLARTILRSAVTVAKHGGRLGKKFLPGYKIAKWVLANEDTIRELFNDNERMSDLVDSLIELLKKLPLKKG